MRHALDFPRAERVPRPALSLLLRSLLLPFCQGRLDSVSAIAIAIGIAICSGRNRLTYSRLTYSCINVRVCAASSLLLSSSCQSATATRDQYLYNGTGLIIFRDNVMNTLAWTMDNRHGKATLNTVLFRRDQLSNTTQEEPSARPGTSKDHSLSHKTQRSRSFS